MDLFALLVAAVAGWVFVAWAGLALCSMASRADALERLLHIASR